MKKPTPTFLQIISTDYLTLNYFVMIFAGWVIYAVDTLFGGNATFLLAVFAAICTPIGLVTFFWRYNLIFSAFLHGTEIEGQVTQITAISAGKKNKDYIIQYRYDLNGQSHVCRNRVRNTSFAQTLKQGQPVILLIQKKNPKIAFIRELYFENP